jgi:hypothetical protein
MYPLDSHTAGQLRTRRAHGDYNELAWLSLKAKKTRRRRRCRFHRFIHNVLGKCFR